MKNQVEIELVLIVQSYVGEKNSPTVIAAEITSEIPQTLLSIEEYRRKYLGENNL